jgi:hypothetical protein
MGLEPSHVESWLLATPTIYRAPNAEYVLSPSIKKVITLAVDEARHMGSHRISSGHLLLGLMGQSEEIGVASSWWPKIDPKELRRQTLNALESSGKETLRDD